MLQFVLGDGHRGLLVWDSASNHRTKYIENFLAERKINQKMISLQRDHNLGEEIMV